MDSRKLLWLGGLAIAGLVGCTHQENKSRDPYVSSPPMNGAPDSKQAVRKAEPIKESKILDAKPETCVKVGDLNASLALDKQYTEEERAAYARHSKEAYKRAMDLNPKLITAYLGMGRLCTWLNE